MSYRPAVSPKAGVALRAVLRSHRASLTRRYYFDASLTANVRFRPELKVYWRYSLAKELTLELKKQSATKKAGPITTNLSKLTGMMMLAFVMQIMENDRPEYAGDPVLLRGDNI